MFQSLRLSKMFVYISLALVLSACAATLKLHYFGTTKSSDYVEYVATAHAFAGEIPITEAPPYRVLKPLAPSLIATLNTFLPDESAVLFQSLLFYFALVVLMYFFAYEFLHDHHLAFLATLMVSLSYPMLKYGVDIFTETGAVFFYVLSLLYTLRMLRTPRLSLVILNALAVGIGFLWKEYSVVAGITFGLTLLFHPHLTMKEKVNYVLLFGGVVALINAPWELWVYLKYHYWYGMWYQSNAGPGFALEFTLKNVLKSIAAVLGLAWLLVPVGVYRWKTLDLPRLRFLQIATLPPFMALSWGYISSRLFYVMGPPFLMLGMQGMRQWPRLWQNAATIIIVGANITWLFLSYSVKL